MDVASFGFKATKFQGDPTASGVPFLAANPEQGFFKTVLGIPLVVARQGEI
jgi:hypothetical protein